MCTLLKQPKHYNPHTPYIHRLTVYPRFEQLWSHIHQRTTLFLQGVPSELLAERVAQPKITDAYRGEIVLVLDEDIFGLQVPMHDIQGVDVGEGLEDGM